VKVALLKFDDYSVAHIDYFWEGEERRLKRILIRAQETTHGHLVLQLRTTEAEVEFIRNMEVYFGIFTKAIHFTDNRNEENRKKHPLDKIPHFSGRTAR